MPDQYLPGAELHLLDDAATDHDGGARAIWHITWDKDVDAQHPADQVPIDNLIGYFTGPSGRGSAPHLLWDPFTGRIAQMFSATSRSKSVVNLPGGVETNRQGDICIQIEVVFFPNCRVNGRVYATVADTPCIGLDRIVAWLRSWGVPDVWPMGAPTWNSNRNAAIWDSQSGHYGHSQVPENDHTDPGPMPNLFAHQEDDVITPDDLERIGSAVANAKYPRYDQTGKHIADAELYLLIGGFDMAIQRHDKQFAALQAGQVALGAAVKAMADASPHVDTQTVVDAINAAADRFEQSLADSVVHVQVDVTQPTPKGTN